MKVTFPNTIKFRPPSERSLWIWFLCIIGFILLFTVVFPLNRIHFEKDWLDSGNVQDESLTSPNYLVSNRFPTPNAMQKQLPVVIVVHGFSATTFEWDEFKRFADCPSENILVSQPLSGGHGRSLDDFKRSSWQDWEAPVMKEYKALVRKGYVNISVMGASLGGTILLDLVARHQFDAHPPRHLILIDPLIEPANKLLHLAPVLGLFINAMPREPKSKLDFQNWHLNRPREALIMLNRFLGLVKNELKSGVTLPKDTTFRVYQSQGDLTVDPKSGQFIRDHVRDSGGNYIEFVPVDSNKHVFTQLASYPPSEVTPADRMRQKKAFAEIVDRLRH